MGMAKGDMAAKSAEVGSKHERYYFRRATQKEQCKTSEEIWQNEDRISKATDNARLKGGGNPVSQHKIQMIGYFANLVGLGFNFLGTFLLLLENIKSMGITSENLRIEGWSLDACLPKEWPKSWSSSQLIKAHTHVVNGGARSIINDSCALSCLVFNRDDRHCPRRSIVRNTQQASPFPTHVSTDRPQDLGQAQKVFNTRITVIPLSSFAIQLLDII
jgi:hypothetical protein